MHNCSSDLYNMNVLQDGIHNICILYYIFKYKLCVYRVNVLKQKMLHIFPALSTLFHSNAVTTKYRERD